MRVGFYSYVVESRHFKKEVCMFFSSQSQLVKFDFFSFFTLIGVKLLEITFSIINGDSCVIGVTVDSVKMNLGKGII